MPATVEVAVSTPTAIPLPDGLLAGIDRAAEIPIGVQLAWALRSCIRDGRFSPAQRLPGLRELADAVGVNVNTVRAVYQRLEREGLIDSRQGSGTFVSQSTSTRSPASTIAADAAREALAAGADPREVAAALYVAPSRSDRPAADPTAVAAASGAGVLTEGGSPEEDAEAAAAVARRRALRAQIAGLERAIAEMETEHPGVAPTTTPIARHGGPTLLSAEELEQVRSALVRRLAAVQTAIDERVTAAATGTAMASKAKTATAHTASDAQSSPSQGKSAPTRPDDGRPTKPHATPRPATAGT
jgi:DNA-binding transcriptional regulator YhcF (GntR family)